MKMHKFIKASVLDEILDEAKLFTLKSSRQKKYIDSIEPGIRHRMQKMYERPINTMAHAVGEFNRQLVMSIVKKKLLNDLTPAA